MNTQHIMTTLLAVAAFHLTATSAIENMRCEYLTAPMAVDAASPRLTWIVTDTIPFDTSIVEVVDDATGKSLWKSPTLSATTRRVDIDTPLQPLRRYRWTVTTFSGAKKRSSATAAFETGPQSTWHGSWITDSHDRDYEPSPCFTKVFHVDKSAVKSRLYISAAGYYVAYINGHRVGDSHMDPGYTHYDRRNLYATHDVTSLLTPGENTISVVLGNGFYNCQSKAVWDFETARWRNRPSMICDLLTFDKKGRPTVVAASDTTWTASACGFTYNNIYSGDRYDARHGLSATVEKARTTTAPAPTLKSQMMPPIRPVERIHPQLIKSWGDTIFVYDMGKNIAGVAEIAVADSRSNHFTLSCGELLTTEGRLLQDNINVYYRPEKPGEKFQTDEFTTKGDGTVERFSPEFTYHGFRYVEVKADSPVSLSADKLTGLMIHTDLTPVGRFSCSNPLLNKIYEATMLSYLDNLHSIPTDCPQREKNGWTADAHAAIDLALLNFDGITFYEKWMNDFADNQRPSGNIAGIIPSSGWGYGDWPGPVWDAAMFIIPNALYDYYGDSRAIADLYPTMERYFQWCRSNENADGLLTNGIGDWVAYHTPTPTDFTSSVYYYLDCRLMARFASLLGHDAAPFERKAASLRDKINSLYFNEVDNTYAGASQAALGVALYIGIVPEGKEAAVARRLHEIVAANDYYLDFGLLGSKTVLRMLTKYGYVDDAYRMATKTEAPSWGYWIERCGYTTLPETWTLSPEFHDASLNHVFLGDISAWMTSDLAGINFDPDSPGFSHIIFRPHFPAGLNSASATYESVRGLVASQWSRSADGSEVTITVTIPVGSTATIYADGKHELTAGTHTLKIKL